MIIMTISSIFFIRIVRWTEGLSHDVSVLLDHLRGTMMTDGVLAPPRLGEEQPRGPRA